LNSGKKSASIDDRPMSSPSLMNFGPRTFENCPDKLPHTKNWTAKKY